MMNIGAVIDDEDSIDSDDETAVLMMVMIVSSDGWWDSSDGWWWDRTNKMGLRNYKNLILTMILQYTKVIFGIW